MSLIGSFVTFFWILTSWLFKIQRHFIIKISVLDSKIEGQPYAYESECQFLFGIDKVFDVHARGVTISFFSLLYGQIRIESESDNYIIVNKFDRRSRFSFITIWFLSYNTEYQMMQSVVLMVSFNGVGEGCVQWNHMLCLLSTCDNKRRKWIISYTALDFVEQFVKKAEAEEKWCWVIHWTNLAIQEQWVRLMHQDGRGKIYNSFVSLLSCQKKGEYAQLLRPKTSKRWPANQVEPFHNYRCSFCKNVCSASQKDLSWFAKVCVEMTKRSGGDSSQFPDLMPFSVSNTTNGQLTEIILVHLLVWVNDNTLNLNK